MTQRLKTFALSLAVLVIGLGLIVTVTERVSVADGAGPRLLTVGDVVDALDEHVTVDDGRPPAQHPLLSIPGTTLTFAGGAIDVFIYPSVAARVAEEQVVQRSIMRLQGLTTDGERSLRVTSARNVLMLYVVESAGPAHSIHEAARALTVVAAP